MSKHTTQGFVLVYTILIISAVVSASAMMTGIYIKNLKLSGLVQESMVAYNAAEMGGECVLYWFLRSANFDVTDADVQALEDDGAGGFTPIPAECNGVALHADSTQVMEILLVPGDSTEPCAVVNVTYGGAAGTIHIRSRGYNTCQTSALRVERGYDIYYR